MRETEPVTDKEIPTASAPFHVGLTPATIVDAATELTRESHLFGWSLRDLAGRLEVAPSVIYHHVGGKDLLARHVVERVLTQLKLPAETDWQGWFRELLHSGYPLICAHPGVAKWTLLHGPTFPVVAPIVDAGIAALRRAGFGAQTSLAYATILNNAMLTISIGDERLLHEADGPRDHATMMEEFRRAAAQSTGAGALAEDLLSPLTTNEHTAAEVRERYFRFVVETTLAGLEQVVSPDGGPHP